MTFHPYRLKKDSAQVFFCEFYQIFQNAAFAKPLWMAASAKYPALFVTSTSDTKNVSLHLGYFKCSRDKHWIACEQLCFVEVLDRQSAGLSLFIADRAGDISWLLLEIESSRAAVDYKNEVLKTWQISQKTFKTVSLFS